MLVGSFGWRSGSGVARLPGAARLYVLNDSSWQLEQKIDAPAELDYSAGFGMATALTTTAAFVCAPFHEESTGIVYVYTQQQGRWAQRQSIPGAATRSYLGWSIAASGDAVIISAHGSSGHGSAYTYRRATDGLWSLEHVFSDGEADTSFGFSVALRGNMAAVGALKAGLAYVYRRTGTQWDEGVQLVGPTNFGIAVGISATTMMVGAAGVDPAATDGGGVFVYDIDTFSLQQTLRPSDAVTGGFVVRYLVLQDNMAVVATTQADAPYVLTFNGTAWHETQRPPLVVGDSVIASSSGVSLALQGDWLVVGTFERVSVWQQLRTTTTTALSTATSSTSFITFPIVQKNAAPDDTDNTMVIAIGVGAAVLLCVCGIVVVAVAMRSKRRWERGGRQPAGHNVRRQKLSTRSTSHGRTLTASSRSVSRGTHMRSVSRQASSHSLRHPHDHYGKLPQTSPDDSALYSNIGTAAGGVSAPYSNIGVAVDGSGGAEYESGAVLMALATAKKGGGAYQRGELGVRDSTEYADSDVLLLRRAANEAIYTPGPMVSDEK